MWVASEAIHEATRSTTGRPTSTVVSICGREKSESDAPAARAEDEAPAAEDKTDEAIEGEPFPETVASFPPAAAAREEPPNCDDDEPRAGDATFADDELVSGAARNSVERIAPDCPTSASCEARAA